MEEMGIAAAADNYLDAHWIRLREWLKGGPNRKWKWPLDKWKPSPDDRVRELTSRVRFTWLRSTTGN
jgi:hypothetical protein